MRRTNINAVLRMVREYLNGDMNEIDFYLDFPYEIEKRYQKMCREDPDYADLIYYYLVENGTDLHRSMTSEEFHDHIQKQYDKAGRKILCKRFSTKSRMALESRADSGLNPLITESHGGQNGMRAGTA